MSWLRLTHRYGSLPSTMDEAWSLARAGDPEGTTVVAEAQADPRGRRGRTYFAPKGLGLWMTTLLRPQSARDGLHGLPVPLLSIVSGLAVQETLSALGAPQTRLKWPNDVVAGPRKVAGILLESDGLGTRCVTVLIGIGINVARRTSVNLPPALQERYAGLADLVPTLASGPGPVEICLAGVLKTLQAWYYRWQAGDREAIVEAWTKVDALRGREVRVRLDESRVLTGVADGINGSGELRVRTETQTVCVAFGEVEQVRPC